MIEVKLKRNEVVIKSPRYIGCTVFWYSKMMKSRPKCYCLLDVKDKTIPKSKGVSLKQNAQILQMQIYKEALNEIKQIQGKNIQILKTTPTTMETAEQTKIALTPYDYGWTSTPASHMGYDLHRINQMKYLSE